MVLFCGDEEFMRRFTWAFTDGVLRGVGGTDAKFTGVGVPCCVKRRVSSHFGCLQRETAAPSKRETRMSEDILVKIAKDSGHAGGLTDSYKRNGV
jgi:hypothetical protein